MAYSYLILLACTAVAAARYNPYSPYPPANARDPSLPRSSKNSGKFSASNTSSRKPMSLIINGKPRLRFIYQRQFITEGTFQYNSFRNLIDKQRSKYAPMKNDFQSNGGRTPFVGYSDGKMHHRINNDVHHSNNNDHFSKPSIFDPDGDNIIGEAGNDYPAYDAIPRTSFQCSNQQFPGIYGDPEAHCQVFHICQHDGRHDSFLCPKGSIFNQQYFVCDWWYNVDCRETPNFYSLNADIYSNSDRYSQLTSYALNHPSNERISLYGSPDFFAAYGSVPSSFHTPSSAPY